MFMETLGIDLVEGMANIIQKYDDSFIEKLCLLQGDCVNAVLSDVGRKIVEDG